MIRLKTCMEILVCFCLQAALASAEGVATPPGAKDAGGTPAAQRFTSQLLGGDVILLPGVFPPLEAEVRMLPFMKANADLFAGKRVLEIGSGSGIVSVYAAKLGAKAVVATDIDSQAVKATRMNAEKYHVDSIVEARLVPPTDISAYSVLKAGETFDTIISNPPYTLDLDAAKNDPLYDTGDLGFSIIRGLDQRLAPGGKAVLLYATMFYHMVMVKYAEYSGFAVRNHQPIGVSDLESEVLFNSYLRRLLAHEKINPTTFQFTKDEPGPLRADPNKAINTLPSAPTGMMVIERKERRGACLPTDLHTRRQHARAA